jgi:MATE family multidrug resistance protein
LFWWSEPLLLRLGQQADVARLAEDFLRIAGLGMIPALMVMAIKSYLAALERTQVVLWVTLLAVLVNAVLAYALIFGHWSAPEMGVRGAGLASLIVQVLTAVILLIYAGWLPELRRFHLFQRFWRADTGALISVFRLGWPIGVTALAESGLFAATALMIGWIGAVPLAAHGIAMEVTSLTFMLHLGLSNAATVRAGRAHGAGDAIGLRDGAKAAIGLSVIIGLINIALMLTFSNQIIGLFLDMGKVESAEILAYGAMLLMFAALFQMADAMQVMALGLLRGMHDTRVPMIMAAVSYWGIGMPAGYVLGFPLGLGGGGLWLGLVIGLTVAAVTMMWRFWRRA